MIRAPDGFYYAYATQTKVGDKWINIQLARSSDLVTWRQLGDALPAKPNWASKTQDFWAPHVVARAATPISCIIRPSRIRRTSGTACASASPPRAARCGPFVDKGTPLKCGDGFLNIDPMAFDDPATGKPLLYWGSGFGPLKVQELGPDFMSFAAGQRADRAGADRQERPRALPGADRRQLGDPPRRLLLPVLLGE